MYDRQCFVLRKSKQLVASLVKELASMTSLPQCSITDSIISKTVLLHIWLGTVVSYRSSDFVFWFISVSEAPCQAKSNAKRPEFTHAGPHLARNPEIRKKLEIHPPTT